MAYPANTSQVLRFLGYENLSDFNVRLRDGEYQVIWSHADPQPTDTQVITHAASQAFLDWLAAHGGDANLTRRRTAKEALDGLSADNALVRALALTIMDELNLLRAEHALAPRTGAQLRNAIKAKLDAGDADT